MSFYNSSRCNTQNDLLMKSLLDFYKNKDYLYRMMRIINGESKISLRIVDWFVTNYSKKYYTVYSIKNVAPPSTPVSAVSVDSGLSVGAATNSQKNECVRVKVYNDYKLKLKSYGKKNLDPFCRWTRINIPLDDERVIETTIGQLNFFKWAIETKIIEYIEDNYDVIESDMNSRNSTSKRKYDINNSNAAMSVTNNSGKTRKKREELSISACKCIKKENVNIKISFS
jgi:hypothetical protein